MGHAAPVRQVRDLWAVDAFRLALAAELVAIAISVVRVQGRRIPPALSAVVAALAALWVEVPQAGSLAAVAGVVAAAVAVVWVRSGWRWRGVAMAGAAALAVAGAAPDDAVRAAQGVGPSAIVLVLWVVPARLGCWADGGAQARHGATALALAAGAAYACLPDTEMAAVVLGVAIPLAVTAWVTPRVRLGGAGLAALGGLVGWAAVVDGVRGSRAVVGTACALAVVGLWPVVVRGAARRLGRGAGGVAAYAVLVAGLAGASRWAGVAPSVGSAQARAAVVLAGVAAVSGVALVAGGRRGAVRAVSGVALGRGARAG